MIPETVVEDLKTRPQHVFAKVKMSKDHIWKLLEKIAHYRAVTENITYTLSEDPVFGSYPSSKIENCAVEISALEGQIAAEYEVLTTQKELIKEILDTWVDSASHRQVMIYKYIVGLSWTTIAKQTGKSRRWVLKIQRKVFEEISEKACTFTGGCGNM